MGCLCYCDCERKRRKNLNLGILVLSSLCVVLSSISLGLNGIIADGFNIAFEITLIVINAIVSGIQSFQLQLEKNLKKNERDKEDVEMKQDG